jgi:hypothetical protein
MNILYGVLLAIGLSVADLLRRAKLPTGLSALPHMTLVLLY